MILSVSMGDRSPPFGYIGAKITNAIVAMAKIKSTHKNSNGPLNTSAKPLKYSFILTPCFIKPLWQVHSTTYKRECILICFVFYFATIRSRHGSSIRVKKERSFRSPRFFFLLNHHHHVETHHSILQE